MATISPFLRLTLQAFNENIDQWGEILNVSALECLEDAIAGTGTVDVTSGDITLTDTEGGPSAETGNAHSRWGILNVIGSPGVDTRQVITPARSKIYLVANNTGDSSDVTVIPNGGSGVTIPAGVAQYVYCDGTDMLAVSAASATTAVTAASAVDSAALGGTAAADFAVKNAAQTFTRGQVTSRTAVASASGNLTINCSNSNAFYLETTESFTLLAPTNATNGQQFSLAIQQGSGGPHSIAFAASTFIAANGVAPTLSTTAGDVDYLAFEYVTGLQAPFSGNRWIVSQLKDMGDL